MEYKIFGCKVNKYYTDSWLESEYLKDKKGIFIASCVVTDKAKKKWIKFVKDHVKTLNPDEKLYISGCGTIKKGKLQDNFYDLYSELIEFKEKIELLEEAPKPLPILSNLTQSSPIRRGETQKGDSRDKNQRGDCSFPSPSFSGILKEGTGNLRGLRGEVGVGEEEQKKERLYTKKFLLIQSGCDNFCSFCLTVIKRGKHFSRDKDEIVNEILDFEKNGGKEVVLTGVNLGAWGSENTNNISDSKFNELLEYILENTNIERIRISSLGPEFVNDKTLEIFKNTRIYPHFHYSVQSGSSKILKTMKRHYDGDYVKNLLEKTKNLQREDGVEVSIGADLLVGFPSETEEDFLETYNLIKDGFITKVHVFPFSNHKIGETVPASFFPEQVEEKIKKERVKKIEEIGEKIRNEFIKRNMGKEFEVLIEVVKTENGSIKWKGWTQNYIEVNERNFEVFVGEVKRNSVIEGELKS